MSHITYTLKVWGGISNSMGRQVECFVGESGGIFIIWVVL